MSRKFTDQHRIKWSGAALGGCFILATISQVFAQVGRAPDTIAKAKAHDRWEKLVDEKPIRGNVLTSDGKQVARNVDVYEFSLNYQRIPRSSSFFAALSEVTGIPAAELQMPADYNPEKIRTWPQDFTQDQRARVQIIQSSWRAHGVSMQRVPRREYPDLESYSALVGTVAGDISATGLEAGFEETLCGKAGKRLGFTDRRGVFLPMRMTGEDTRSVPGKDLHLTIQSDLQQAASDAVRRAVMSNNAMQGVAIVMEPGTGKILASATWTESDTKGIFTGFNPAVMANFEPGSTFKILTLAKAMDMGKVNPDKVIPCGGSITIGPKTIRCSHGAHGPVNGRDAIARSCNVSSVLWAQEIERTNLIRFFVDLGLLQKPDLGLPGELEGSYVRNEFAKKLQLANFGFGQAFSSTPVALCAAYNTLANDGKYAPPQLVEKIDEEQAKAKRSYRVLGSETAKSLMDYMVSTFEDKRGTAHSLRIPGYTLAGKTGTAQKVTKNWEDKKRAYVSNFVGYVPAENPRATILVMIDTPRGGSYYGGTVAGPVFKSIAEAVIRHYNIPKTQ